MCSSCKESWSDSIRWPSTSRLAREIALVVVREDDMTILVKMYLKKRKYSYSNDTPPPRRLAGTFQCVHNYMRYKSSCLNVNVM